MKITDIEVIKWNPGTGKNFIYIKLTTDTGISGWGEAYAQADRDTQIEAHIDQLARYLINRDPFHIRHFMHIAHEDFATKRSAMDLHCALSGIEIAMWDIVGKAVEQPIYNLIGGPVRQHIRVYANGWYTNPGTPKQNAEEAKIVTGMGYTALKFDPFGQENFYKISLAELQLAEDRVAAVRKAVGPHVDILVEAHAKFNVMNAIQIGRRMEEYFPLFYEEPVSQERVAELAEVRSRVNIPIATGERLYTKFPFAEIVEQHAADVLQPDIANAGGITELKKIAIIAEAKHITMAPHNVCSPVGAMAEMHLDASVINFEIQEYHAEFYTEHYFTVLDGLTRQVDGYVELSDAPGLGLELNEAEIAKHPPLARMTSAGGTVRGI